MEPGELFNAIVEHFSWQIPSAREIGRLIGQLSRATSQRPKFLIVRELLGRKKVCRLSPEGVAVATGRAILEFGADGRMILVEVKETEIKDLSYLRAELEKLRTSLAEKDEANQALSKKLEQTETLTRQFEVKTRELEARQEALEQGLREAKAKMAEAEARIKEVEQRAKTEIAFRLSGEKNVLRLSIEARKQGSTLSELRARKESLG